MVRSNCAPCDLQPAKKVRHREPGLLIFWIFQQFSSGFCWWVPWRPARFFVGLPFQFSKFSGSRPLYPVQPLLLQYHNTLGCQHACFASPSPLSAPARTGLFVAFCCIFVLFVCIILGLLLMLGIICCCAFFNEWGYIVLKENIAQVSASIFLLSPEPYTSHTHLASSCKFPHLPGNIRSWCVQQTPLPSFVGHAAGGGVVFCLVPISVALAKCITTYPTYPQRLTCKLF